MHVVQVPFTSNISQKFLTFSLEVFKIRSWYFSRIFYILLIGTTKPLKIIFQGIEPSVYEVNTEKNINKSIYCKICW